MAEKVLGITAEGILCFLDLIVGLLSFWHTYRAFILLFVALAVVRSFSKSKPKSRTSSTCSTPPWPREIPRRKSLSAGDCSSLSERQNTVVTPDSRVPSVQKPKYPENGPKRLYGIKPVKGRGRDTANSKGTLPESMIEPRIFFYSLTGSTERSAQVVSDRLRVAAQSSTKGGCRVLLPPQVHDISEIDFDDYFIKTPRPLDYPSQTRFFYALLIPTYNIDTIMNVFLSNLDETHHDFRIDTAPLSSIAGYSVFGFGDKEGWPTEEEGFCSQAKEVDKWMAKLTGRKRAYPLGMGDVKGDAESALREWCDGLQDVLNDLGSNGGLGDGVPGSGDAVESDEETDDKRMDRTTTRQRTGRNQIIDLEDINFGTPGTNERAVVNRAALPIDFTTYPKSDRSSSEPSLKEMVPTTSPTYAALTKQGYTIVGSHSGVKICRWTKSALRGRGSCYKNSFYGIKSHLCMETTPSLSCSNKCVFCWRHGTNPVGTTWRWKLDPPDLIFQGVKEGHYKKIKMMRGVPGVRAERFAEAMRIRHCALSLVGEPIFYPHINEFVSLLHGEHISSFLVCNAQHPDQLTALHRVTQLYVSIDASNCDSLRKIDRPLHRDFWERFQRCLDILREKRHVQRTVYRLTLVKGFNIDDEVVGYADLIDRGLPCFVEVKGVTYCGTSSSAAAGLTMQNVPFYEEVVSFVVALNDELCRRGLGYGIAAEHNHSCCVLLASNRFQVGGKWHTRIDYDKFFELLERENKHGVTFRPEDYMRETESWALWGNGGFDPSDQRVYRKGRNKKSDGIGLGPSETGTTATEA
jgi:tRNA wybutosine-synthesizing protein 1